MSYNNTVKAAPRCTEEQLVRLAMLEAQVWRPFHEQPPTDGQYLALWESGCISCEYHEVGRRWKQGITHWRLEPNRPLDYKRQDVECHNVDCQHNRSSNGAMHNPRVCAPGLVFCACRKPNSPHKGLSEAKSSAKRGLDAVVIRL